jgi:hypothetical protein
MRAARPRRLGGRRAALAALVLLAGCGGYLLRHADAAGSVRVDDVAYKVTRVNVLEPALPNDRALLAGAAASPPPGVDWLGVFVQAANTAGSPRLASGTLVLLDGAHHVFRPVQPAASNAYAYRPVILGPHAAIPPPGSAAAYSPEQGSVVLFEVPSGDLRSGLQLRIYDPAHPSDFASLRLTGAASHR